MDRLTTPLLHLATAFLATAFLTAALVVAVLAAPAGLAEVPVDEAAKLDAGLTPLGAERAGNAEGTIPPWTGGITEPPADYKPGARHPDPYADDSVRFTITAENQTEHADHLTDGQRALLLAHPESWRMNVYPTHRSASYPEWVYEAVRANATAAQVVLEGKGGVEGARVSSPFPIPKSGVEVIWNHNLRWRGVLVSRTEGQTAVTRLGNYTVTLSVQEIGIPYGAPTATAFTRRYPNVMFALKSKIISPALLSGDGTLAIEPIDQTRDPRKVWSYSRALRRVLRNPHIAYDFPAPNSANLRTVDDGGLFIGPPDRFEWTLRGKREIYIPYNAYRLHGRDVGHADILRTGHINPDLARYELHRVWVVEGVLKADETHVYSRRVFYVDEDSWQIAVAESYDREGQLWRVNEAHALNLYEVPVLWDTLQVYHDLDAGRYAVSGLDNGRNPPRFREGGDPRDFNPNALTYYVR
jgi:Protein of unknown function (DUF1329)